jgi:hypothetical protein
MTDIVAMPIQDLEAEKFMFSEKKIKSWDFKNKKTGKQMKGAQPYVECYYEKPGQKLCFTIENVKSYNGVQTGENLKRGFMSVNLTEDMSKSVKKFVDSVIFQLCFNHRAELVKNGKKITSPAEMRIIYSGCVTEGKDKEDGTGECWQDQLTANVPMKRKGQQSVVDDNLCVIEDLDSKPYAWSALDGVNLREVAVEVEKVTFAEVIRVNMLYRLITPDEKAKPRVTTKRRLEAKTTASSSKRKAGDDHHDSNGGDQHGDDSNGAGQTGEGQTGGQDATASATAATSEPPTKKSRKLPAAE